MRHTVEQMRLQSHIGMVTKGRATKGTVTKSTVTKAMVTASMVTKAMGALLCRCDGSHTSGGDPMVCGGAPGPAACPVEQQKPIHEHDLMQLPNGTYAIFYAGNTAEGDQGFLATSVR